MEIRGEAIVFSVLMAMAIGFGVFYALDINARRECVRSAINESMPPSEAQLYCRYFPE